MASGNSAARGSATYRDRKSAYDPGQAPDSTKDAGMNTGTTW